MDELISTALEELALEGRAGCSVPELWQLLEQKLPISNITQLGPEIKHYLWRCLVQRTEDLQLFRETELPPAALPAQPSAAAPTRKGRKPKAVAQPTSKRTIVSPDEVPDYNAAMMTDVRLLASEAVRMGVLGLYDALHCRFALSEPQLKTLEMIARKRTLGVLQSVLASQMQITNSNFFYVVKCLEERGLIARTPIMVTNQRSNATVLTTNVLHLQRFAPAVRLGPYQVFKMVDSPGGQQQLDMDTATYTIQDDARLMRLICERVGSTEDRVVIESELKVVLGFSGKRGHRTWRRLRAKLIKSGHIESFAAEVNGRTVMCLRLLKEFRVAGEDGEDDDAGDDKRDTGALLVEVSVERQVLEAILATGEEGVLNTQLFMQLGLNHKRSGALLSELVKKYGLTVTVVTVNKAIHNRIQAPRHLLEQYQQANALLTAGASGGPLLLFGPDAPSTQQTPPLLPLPPLPTPGGEGNGLSSLNGTAAARPQALKAIAAAKPAAEAALVTPGTGEQQRSQSLTPEPGLTAQAQPTYRAMRPQRVTTDLSDDRLRRLLERLDEHGYIVAYEIRGFLYRYEVEKGLLPASNSLYQKGPDKKTINRLLARMEATGRAKQMTITVPGSYTNGELRTMHVVVPTSFQPTDEKVKEIQEYFIGIERRARSASTKNYFAARAAILQSASPHMSAASPGGVRAGKGASGAVGLPAGAAKEDGGVMAGASVAAAGAGMAQQATARLRLGSLSQPVSRLLPEGTNMRAVRAELALQEGSKRGVGALSHKQLFGSSPVSLRSLTQIIKPGLGVVERMPDNMAVLMGSAYQGEGSYSRLLLNGFNWCKMARVRLLHYFICRCVGLGGFQQVAAGQEDIAGNSHMHAAAGAGSLPYHGPSLYAALQSCKPPPPSEPDALDAAVSGPAGTYTITGRQLWAAIPMGLALQVMGTTHEVPDLLALCQANTCLGDLTPAHLDRLFDKTAHKRFSKLLGLLQQLQLLTVTSATVAGSGLGTAALAKPAQIPTGDIEQAQTGMAPAQHVTYYHVASKGWMEEPPAPPQPTPAEDEAGKAANALAVTTTDTAAADARPSKRRRGASSAVQKEEVPDAPMQGQEGAGTSQGQADTAACLDTTVQEQQPQQQPQPQGEGDVVQADVGTEAGTPVATRGGWGRKRGGGTGRGRGRPKGRTQAAVEMPSAGEAATSVRLEMDLHTADGLEEYWQKLETIFGKTSSSKLAAQCFPATVVTELMATPLWSNLRARVSTVTWLQLVAAVRDMLGGTTELDKDTLAQLAHAHGVDRQVVNRVVQEHLKRQLSAAGMRGRLSAHVRRAATSHGRGPGRRAAAAAVGEEEGDAAHKRTREARREARRVRKAEKQQEKLEAARQGRARELARLQSHQTLVLSQLQANQQALSVASEKLADLQSAMLKAEEGYTDVVTAQEYMVQFQQVKREVQVKSQEEGRLKEQLKKLQAKVLQLQAAAAAADKQAAAEAEAAAAGKQQLRKKKSRSRGAETDGEVSSGGETSDGEDLAGSEVEDEGGDEEVGEGEGEGEEGGAGTECAVGAAPLRPRRGRHYFTRSDDEALLRAWITLRVDKGMEYSTAAGRLPWMEMRGLPTSRKACYSRMALINKKYRPHMDSIVAAIRVAHARLMETRSSNAQAAAVEGVATQATGDIDMAGGALKPDMEEGTQAGKAAGAQQQVAAGAAGDEVTATQTAAAAAAEAAVAPAAAVSGEAAGTAAETAVAGRPVEAAAAASQREVVTGSLPDARCEEALQQLVDEVMKGPVAAMLALMPERQSGGGGGGSHLSAPLRMEQPEKRRPALLATGLFGKSLMEVARQARDSLPAAVHHMGAMSRSSTLAMGVHDHTTLSPGTLCAMQLICSLLVMQTWQAHSSGVHSSQGVAEGAQALARRFSEADLRAALLALRMGGWLSSGVGGTNAWQLSPQFHNHLEGNVEVRRARALGQGAQLLASLLARRLMPTPVPGPQVTRSPAGVDKASDFSTPGLQGPAADTHGSGTTAATQGAAGLTNTHASDTGGVPPGASGLANGSSIAAPATIVGGQVLVTQSAVDLSAAGNAAQLAAVAEQFVDLCPDLFSPLTLSPVNTSGTTAATGIGQQGQQQAAAKSSQPALQKQTQQQQQQQQHEEDQQAVLQLHTGAVDVDVPSELLMVLLPCLATTQMRLAVQRVGHANEEGLAQPQEPAAGGLSIPLTLTLSAGDMLDKLLAPGAAALSNSSSMRALPSDGDELSEHNLQVSGQLAVCLSSEPSYMLGLPSKLLTPLPGCQPSHLTGQQPALRSAAEDISTRHLQALTDHLQATGMVSPQLVAICSQAMPAVLAAVRSCGPQGSSFSALQAVLNSTYPDSAGVLQQQLPQDTGWGIGVDGISSVVAVLVAVLLRAGLVRVIAAFNHTRIAAVESSQHLVAVPSTRTASAATAASTTRTCSTAMASEGPAGDAATLGAGVETTQAAAGRGNEAANTAQVKQQAAREVLLAPWHDCRGHVNSVYLQALVQRAVLAVERAPGSAEHSLEEALNMVCPTHARQLLRAMAEQGLLRVREMQATSVHSTPRRPSLLGGGPSQQAMKGVAERHYFPVLLAGLPQRASQLRMHGLPAK